MTAALAAIATSVSRSAVPTWLSSSLKPWVSRTRKNCSISQRRLHHSTMRPSRFCSRYRVSGEKPPVQRFGASLRVRFAHIDIIQRQAFGQMVQELALLAEPDLRRSEKFELCSALSPLRPRRRHDQALVHDSHALAGHIQAGPIRELAIMHATGDHMEALLGRVGIKGEDVALAVAGCGYHGGLGKQRLGGQRGSDPALRFLVRQITQVVRDGAATLAGPYLTAHQAETDAVLGVHRQHRVQQHPAAVTPANLPEPAPALCSGCRS